MEKDFYRINTSAILVLPLYNSIMPILRPYENSYPTYFSTLCWDYGLLNTYLNGSLYFLFEKNKFRENIKNCQFSLETFINNNLSTEIAYDLEEAIVIRNTLPTQWYDWITAIKNNQYEKLDDKYIYAASIREPEVSLPLTKISTMTVDYNLPWGALFGYKDYIDKVKEDLKVKELSKWPLPVYDQDKEIFSPEQLVYL